MADDNIEKLLKGLEAVGATLGTITARLDSVDARFDAAEEEKKEERKDAAKKRMDAFNFSKRADGESDDDFKKRGDAEEEEHRKDMMEAGEPEASAVDKAKKARKDAETIKEEEKKEEKKEEKADKKADSEDDDKEEKKEKKEERDDAAFESRLTAMREDIKKDLEARFKPLSRADEDKLTAIQARWDDVYSLYGERAPRALHGQTALAYERSLATPMQKHSRAFKDSDLTVVAVDEASFSGIAAEILASAKAVGMNPATAAPGELRMVERSDGGHTTRTFSGHPTTWMDDFAYTGQTVTDLNRNAKRSN